MIRKSVGYFEGTDSTLLTHLIMSGFDTIPVSNGVDNHGHCVGRITQQTKYDMLIGYLHKIMAQPDDALQCAAIFHICKTYEIPLILEVPNHLQETARVLLPDAPSMVEFLDPADTLNRALELLA